MDWNQIGHNLEYIVLNKFVNQIPSWTIRRYLYLKFRMEIASDARIGIGTVIVNPSGIRIGKRSVVNENCFLDGRGGLKIGRDTSISAYTKIISASHRENGDDFQYFTSETKIGKHVWIGTGATILDGSYIRDYVVIGAGAVLKGDTKERDILVGNPAYRIKKREIKKDYHLKYIAYFR